MVSEDPYVPPDVMPNAEDTHQIEVATILDERREHRDAVDLAKIFNMPEGRRFVTRVLKLTGINRLSELDNAACHRSEGARSVGVEIVSILNRLSLHAYPQLLVEAAIDEEREANDRKAALLKRGALPASATNEILRD